MKYDDKLAALRIIKLLVGADILDGVLSDIKVEDSQNDEIRELVINAKSSVSKLIKKYDELITDTNKLCEIYESCNKSIDWNLKKIMNL